MSSTYSYVYEHLKSLRPQVAKTPVWDVASTIQQQLRDGAPMDETLNRPELKGWTSEDVLDLVAKLGKYIAQSRKTATEAEIREWHEAGTMFRAPSQAEVDAERAALAKDKRAGWKGKTTTFLTPDSRIDVPTVFIPPGWTREDTGKRIYQSIATCTIEELDEQTFAKFVTRTYKPAGLPLNAHHVFLLAWLAHEGNLDQLCGLTEKDALIADALRQAWDLLQAAGSSAQEAIDQLAAHPQLRCWDSNEALSDTLDRCSWVCPGEVTRTKEAVDALIAQPDNVSLARIADSRMRSLAASIHGGHVSAPAMPQGLLAAHAHMVCVKFGLLDVTDSDTQVHDDALPTSAHDTASVSA